MKVRHLFTYDVSPGRLYAIPPAPHNVMLDLTWRCDRHCLFCYVPSSQRVLSDPPTASLVHLVKKLGHWGVQEILYLGGEPTIHPGFREILEVGAEMDILQRLVTHGGRIDSPLARQLAQVKAEVGVSLHGTSPDLHNMLAGVPGAFERGLAGLDALVDAGVSSYVAFSPTRKNENELLDLAPFLRGRYGEGVRFIDVNRLLPYGYAAQDVHSVLLDEDGWWRVMCSIGQLVLSGYHIIVESVPRCWIRKRAEIDGLSDSQVEAILHSLRPCYMGIAQLAFDPSGFVKLCPGGPPVGPSILDHDPESVWMEHPLLIERRLLRFLSKNCVDYETGTLCREFYECGGGCRSAAGKALGAADPLQIACDQSDIPGRHAIEP